MFEALAEFLPLLKADVTWREPAAGRQGGGRFSLLRFFERAKK